MNQIDRNKLLKMFSIMVLLLIIVGAASHLRRRNSLTLDDYAKLHPSQTPEQEMNGGTAPDETGADKTAPDGHAMPDQRVIYPAAADFYYEPLSKNLQRYITGISYPEEAAADSPDAIRDPSGTPSYDDLRYVHILHYDFDGLPAEGELICNAAIAQDLLEIFYELYRNEYQLERVLLVEEYDGDTAASMEADNSCCFSRPAEENSAAASMHALGLAVEINPLYNPSITYNEDGSQNIIPAAAQKYADRTAAFPYKIDESDLCCKLFLKHGFTWGGNHNSRKDYGYFQKALP